MPVEYTVWIVPPAGLRRRLSKIISGLSKKYNSPKFQSHVTLLAVTGLGEKEAIEKTNSALRSLKPFEVNLGKAGYANNFFQCLFIGARKTKGLMHANEIVQNRFGTRRTYMPHLSLMYGNFPVSVKRKIIGEIGNKFDSRFSAKEFWLIRGESPDTRDWHVVKKFRI